jgi:hypothetical protein
MRLGYAVAVHGYGKGVPPFYTSYIEGLGGKQVEGQQLLHVTDQDDHPPLSSPVPPHSSSRVSQTRKDKEKKK